MKRALFKVGDKVKLRDLETVEKIDRSTMTPEMKFDDVREISGIEPMSTVTTYKIEGMGNYVYLEALLEKAECEDTRDFKVGDRVRINPKCKVGETYDRIDLLGCMYFDGYREIDIVDTPTTVGIRDDKGKRWWYSNEMLIKEDTKMDKVKNVSFDEVTLTRDDLKDAYISVAMDLIENPPKELNGDFKAAMVLSLSVPIIGNMIADRLFGKEEKKEDK